MTNIQFRPSSVDAGGCVSNAWNLIKQNYGMYLGVALIGIILSGCIPCISPFLVGPVTGGIFYVVLREMRGEPVEFGMMFKGFEKFVPLMVVGLITAIPEIIGQGLRVGAQFGQIGLNGAGRSRSFQFLQSSGNPELAIASGVLIIIALVAIVLIILAIVWRVLLFFAIPLAMEYDIGPVEAIKLSASAAMSNIGGLILLIILEGLVTLLGIVMCVLGVFFISIPVIFVANAFAYRQVFPWIEQNFNFNPPPPRAYGGDFGSGM